MKNFINIRGINILAAVIMVLFALSSITCFGVSDARADVPLSIDIASNAAAQTPDGDDDNDDGQCPIAAVLGENDPRLDTIRQFRDAVLAKSPVGSKVIALYYATADEAIAELDENPPLKAAAQKALTVLVPLMTSCLAEDTVAVSITSNAAAQTPDGDDDDDNNDDGQCPIAAVLGENDPRLDTIRQFRDGVLAKSAVGSKVIALYYATTDEAVMLLDENPQMKAAAQKALKAIVPIMQIVL